MCRSYTVPVSTNWISRRSETGVSTPIAYICGVGAIVVGLFLPLYGIDAHRSFTMWDLRERHVPGVIPLIVGAVLLIAVALCPLKYRNSIVIGWTAGLAVLEALGVMLVLALGAISQQRALDAGSKYTQSEATYHPGLLVLLVGSAATIIGAASWWIQTRSVDASSR